MIEVEDIVYRKIGGHSLLGRLYRPLLSGPIKWVIDVHGGAWGSGNRLNNEIIHQDLAENGVGVFSLDFRLSNVVQYPAPVEDVSFGIRWFKANIEALGIKASVIGGLGSSSGAQQLGLVALCPNHDTWTTVDPQLEGISASIEFFVACWPILDPLARYEMVKKAGNERLSAAHEAYFPSKKDMKVGNPHLIMKRGEAEHTPPMLIIQGTNDANVNHTWQDEFAKLYELRGGTVRIQKFEKQPHTFVTANPGEGPSIQAIIEIRNFILGISPPVMQAERR